MISHFSVTVVVGSLKLTIIDRILGKKEALINILAQIKFATIILPCCFQMLAFLNAGNTLPRNHLTYYLAMLLLRTIMKTKMEKYVF